MDDSQSVSGSSSTGAGRTGAQIPAGTRLGKYELHAEIGRGGMGAVYRGYDPFLGRWVAIKVLAPHLVWEEGFVERFLREARAAGQLSHRGIVTIYDVGQEGERYYFVMEYLEGQTLGGLIRQRGPLPVDEVLSILRPLAEALDYAHHQGLVHRDIKPGNVILTPSTVPGQPARVTLTDFGIVRAVQESRLTATGAVLGTPEYMSPEQARGLEVNTRSDLYALGVLVYELLAGRVPFRATSTPAILHKVVYEPPPPLHQIRPDLPVELDQVLARALAKEPGERYATCSDFTVALERAASGSQPVSHPATPPPASRPVTSPTGPAPRPQRPGALPVSAAPVSRPAAASAAPPTGKRERRKGVPIWLFGVGALAVLLISLAVIAGGLVLATWLAPTSASPTAQSASGASPTPQLVVAQPVPTLATAATPVDTGPAASSTAEPIRIALLLPMSGDVAVFGESARNGAVLAIEEWNERGGVLGRQIEYVVEDSQCSAEPAVSAANRVIYQDGIHYIIGEVCSSASIPVSEIAVTGNALQISPTSTNPRVTVDGNGNTKPTIFRACFVDPFQGTVAAQFALNNLNAQTAAVFLDQGNEYVRGLAEFFREAFEAGGGEVVVWEIYTGEDQDFSAILTRVKAANPDILYLPDYYSTVNVVAAQAREMGITSIMMGGDGWDSAELDTSAVEGGYFTNHYSPDDPHPVVADWVARYKEHYNTTTAPDALAVLAYDAANILLEAIAQTGTDDPQAVARVMESMTFEAVTGRIAFDAHHDPVKPAIILHVEDGQVQFYTTVRPER